MFLLGACSQYGGPAGAPAPAPAPAPQSVQLPAPEPVDPVLAAQTAQASAALQAASAGQSFARLSAIPQLQGKGYDPIRYSAVASLISREPERQDKTWARVRLPVGQLRSVFGGALTAYFRLGRGPTFVIFPGSFATWKNGSYVNATVAALDRQFLNPNILAFPGPLTPENLERNCTGVPWDLQEIARDYRDRIYVFLRERGLSDVGVVGYSGGASLALYLAAADADAGDSFVTRGVLASSPLMGGAHPYLNLDRGIGKSTVPAGRALTTSDAGNIWTIVKNFGTPGASDVMSLPASAQKDFAGRFFNEFADEDLAGILKHCGGRATRSYFDYFVRQGFAVAKANPDMSEVELTDRYDRETDLKPTLEKIRVPTLIVFSRDDPALATYDATLPLAPALESALADIGPNSRVQLFAPPFGAHTGFAISPRLSATLKILMATPPKKP